MKTFKALAAILEYPTADTIGALSEIETLIEQEPLLNGAERDALASLLALLREGDLIDLQETYVDTFDRGRATSLNLFEHVHGESRDRGQAMVDLKALYAGNGLVLSTTQLPDYLPAVLEYLSLRPFAEAEELLADCAHILQSIESALARRNSPYRTVLQFLSRIAGADPAGDRPAAEDDSTKEAIDRAWAEEPVTFLGGDCSPQTPVSSVIHFHHKGTSS